MKYRHLALFVIAASSSIPAHAIVSSSAASNWTTSTLNSKIGLNNNALNGVAKLLMFNNSTGVGGCSGTLVGNGNYILTAGHCVTNDTTGVLDVNRVTVSFTTGATANVGSVSQIHVFSTWNGTVGENDDLALLELDTPVTSVTSYQLWDSSKAVDPLHASILLAGYGLTGVGSTGYVSGTFGTLHWGLNEWDFMTSNGSYVFDYDNGASNGNASARGHYYNSSSLGMSSDSVNADLEGMIAPGDSGGPSFVYVSNTLYLAGVHSYMSTVFGLDLDGTSLNGSFGEFGVDTAVYASANSTWLAGYTQAVPEPGTASLALAGISLLAWRRRKA